MSQIDREHRTVYCVDAIEAQFGNILAREAIIGKTRLTIPNGGVGLKWFQEPRWLGELEEIGNNINEGPLTNIPLIEFPTFLSQRILGTNNPEAQSFIRSRIKLSLPYTEHMLINGEPKFYDAMPAVANELFTRFRGGSPSTNRTEMNQYINEMLINNRTDIYEINNAFYEQQISEQSEVVIPPVPPIFDRISLRNAFHWFNIAITPARVDSFRNPIAMLFNFSADFFEEISNVNYFIEQLVSYLNTIYSSNRHMVKPEIIVLKVYNEERLLLETHNRLPIFRNFLHKLAEVAQSFEIITIFSSIYIMLASLFEGIDLFVTPVKFKHSFPPGFPSDKQLDEYKIYYFDEFRRTTFGRFKRIVRNNQGQIPSLIRLGDEYSLHDLRQMGKFDFYRLARQSIGESVHQMVADFRTSLFDNQIQAAKQSIIDREKDRIFSRFFQ